MNIRFSYKRFLSVGALVGALITLPGLASADDANGVPTPAGPGPSTRHVEGTGSLTTVFAQNNSFAGNTLDISNIGASPITITSFDLNCTGANQTFTIYYRLDTAQGHESDPTGWVMMGVATGVNCAGIDIPTPVAIGGLTILPGQLRGIYVDLTSYAAGVSTINYTNGGPITVMNSQLSLTTYAGKGNPAFTGGTFFPREWNGTVHYDIVPVELQSFGVE